MVFFRPRVLKFGGLLFPKHAIALGIVFFVFLNTSFFLFSHQVFGQSQSDSLKTIDLKELEVKQQKFQYNILSLPDTKGTFLYSGKKNEVVAVQGLDLSISEKNPRQIFAKIPGIFVYDMDGTGNQINISARGLDPHRGWEFNIRKDGIITNTDLYGYPASHFSLPMEAVQNIELVRGTGSLQYGSQFGGMLNYITNESTTQKKINYYGLNTLGSFGFFSTYHQVQGKLGRFRYFIYINKRLNKGYRDNSGSKSDAEAVQITYQASGDLSVKIGVSHSSFQVQLPGQLTDQMFKNNPKQSTRSRNYYSPDIYIPSVSLNWIPSATTKISWVTSSLLGVRNSVMFDKPANFADEVDSITKKYSRRQVDVDQYNSFNSELRILHFYNLGKIKNVIASGIQAIHNNTYRNQQGLGTGGSDFDLSIEGEFGRVLRLESNNIACFVENRVRLNEKFSLSPGLRLEVGNSKMTGKLKYSELLPFILNRRFPLFGMNSNWQISPESKIYMGWSQAYRPVLFKDLIPASIYEKTDPLIKDSRGWNAEIGYKKETEALKIDLNYFGLMYKNRPGTLALEEPGKEISILRTNVGDSFSSGVEAMIEVHRKWKQNIDFFIFTSTSFIHARYIKGSVKESNQNRDIKGKIVEGTPAVITRNGVTLRIKKYSATLLYSYTAKSFADALNTFQPSASGSVGLVPAYSILDLNQTLRVNDNLKFRFNVNNVLNKQYFTKRPQFYPGPGIWPSDGRSINVSVSYEL